MSANSLGLDEALSVARNEERRFSTPTLATGTYEFTLSGSGDGDLYVRVGSVPTQSRYDCRPYRSGSAETCTVDLSSPAVIHVMVRGYGSSSAVRLVWLKR